MTFSSAALLQQGDGSSVNSPPFPHHTENLHGIRTTDSVDSASTDYASSPNRYICQKEPAAVGPSGLFCQMDIA